MQRDGSVYDRGETGQNFVQYGQEAVRKFPAADDIFSVIRNFARKNHKALELFRFPVRDESLRAFSIVRGKYDASAGEEVVVSAYENNLSRITSPVQS